VGNKGPGGKEGPRGARGTEKKVFLFCGGEPFFVGEAQKTQKQKKQTNKKQTLFFFLESEGRRM
jgi:hypothetical protein